MVPPSATISLQSKSSVELARRKRAVADIAGSRGRQIRSAVTIEGGRRLNRGIIRVTYVQGLQLVQGIFALTLCLTRDRVAGKILRISEKRRLSDLRLWPVDIG